MLNKFNIPYKYRKAFIKYGTIKKLVNLFKIEFQKHIGTSKICGYPYTLTVDITNVCNLKCIYCPTGQDKSGRMKGFITFAEFKNIIDELKDYLYITNLFNWGEPLLNKEVFRMVEYVHKNNIFSCLSSNLNHFNEEIGESLLNSGLDYLIVSIDGINKVSYEKYRKGGDFEKVIKNLEYLLNRRRKLKNNLFIVWRYFIFPHNEHEVNKAEYMAKELGVDKIEFERGKIGIDCYATRNLNVINSNKLKRCGWLWHNAVINWDGGVSPCCLTFYKKDDFGNVFKTGFKNIWNNTKFISSRDIFNRHNEKNADPNMRTVCHRCVEEGLYRYAWIE